MNIHKAISEVERKANLRSLQCVVVKKKYENVVERRNIYIVRDIKVQNNIIYFLINDRYLNADNFLDVIIGVN